MEKNKIKKVLIAIDYDPSSEKIAQQGLQFAKAMGAQAILIHVIADSNYYSSLEYSPVFGYLGFNDSDLAHLQDKEGLKNATTNFLNKLKHHLGDDSVETVVKEGEFGESILKAAKNLDADVIVMGSHSRNWIDSVLLGSVTKNVLSSATIPLFIIPIKEHK